jgi:beta-N-acetylhexosaminidase
MSRPPRAAIVGIAGPTVTAEEASRFREWPPAGVILFARNIRDPSQLFALTRELRRILPPCGVVMVDQEGGRVARLRPPHWRAHPSGATIGALDDAAGARAAWLTGALIGLECAAAGIDVVCAPVLDLRLADTTEAIGDRAYGPDPVRVARLGRAMADGLLAAGVQPVGKHAPGHGRARMDSHFHLPVVAEPDLEADFLPFARNADLPWLMTAHVLYPALDPDHPATHSPRIIGDVIRGRMKFSGLLTTDDLAMAALGGPPAERATRALAAGCDMALYCPGDAEGTESVLRAVPALTDAVVSRLASAASLARTRRLALDPASLQAERDEILS